MGIQAAEKFKQNPLKKQKLEQLSPHWLRHLSASHQDLAGISGTMIQANHRHSAFSSTQIYLHAPDAMCSQSINKLRMNINFPLTVGKIETSGSNTLIRLGLAGNSLGGVDS